VNNFEVNRVHYQMEIFSTFDSDRKYGIRIELNFLGEHDQDTVVSCVEFISLARRAPCLFMRDGKLRPVQIISYYYITITAERIELLLGLIDSLCSNYIVKVSFFLFYEL